MKRLLLALVVAGVLVGVVGAMSLDFQHSTDLNYVTPAGTGTVVLTANTTGGNYWITTGTGSYANGGFRNLYPLQTTYAAVSSSVSSGNTNPNPYVDLLGANLASMGSCAYGGSGEATTPAKRWEVKITGGKAYFYSDGVPMYGCGAVTITTNPSYIAFSGANGGSHKFDELVYGETENKYIVTQPSYTDYKLVKDFITPASSGLKYQNDTVISSTTMFYRVARGSSAVPPVALANETIQLVNMDTGVVYATSYTGASYIKDSTWNVYDALFNTSAPYGRYATTVLGTGAYSDEIWYLGSGATITFDKSSYAGQDIATMTYNIDGAYWDTSTYSYSIDIVSGTTGATMQSTPISAASGTATYTFTNTDPLGVYYGIVKATKLSDSSVIWMNYDYAELTAYVTIAGYVNDAESQLPISGAVVNITQNSITGTATTIADGNYSLTNYLAGTPLSINATASGHSQYYVAITPPSAKTISLNITLNSTTPAYTGLGIGGVAREGTISGSTITGGYGRPISGATIIVKNTSNGESYTKTTSMTGWYLCDEGASCFLISKRPYDMWGEKSGYSNSQNYTVVTA